MRYTEQHIEAVAKTVKVKSFVSCRIFDDKIKEAGSITVEKGEIRIKLDHGFHMVSEEARRDLIMGSIKVGLERCFAEMPEAFEPH